MCTECETIFRDKPEEQRDFHHIKAHGTCAGCAGVCGWCGAVSDCDDKLVDFAEYQANIDELIDNAIAGIEAYFAMQGGSHVKDVLEDLKASQMARQVRKV